jgi:hypothetical protein
MLRASTTVIKRAPQVLPALRPARHFTRAGKGQFPDDIISSIMFGGGRWEVSHGTPRRGVDPGMPLGQIASLPGLSTIMRITSISRPCITFLKRPLNH